MTHIPSDDTSHQATGEVENMSQPDGSDAATSYESQLVCDFFRQIGQLESRGSLRLDAWERVQTLLADLVAVGVAELE